MGYASAEQRGEVVENGYWERIGICYGTKSEMVCKEESSLEKISAKWIEMKVCNGNSTG